LISSSRRPAELACDTHGRERVTELCLNGGEYLVPGAGFGGNDGCWDVDIAQCGLGLGSARGNFHLAQSLKKIHAIVARGEEHFAKTTEALIRQQHF
jgi:hypothetical protein